MMKLLLAPVALVVLLLISGCDPAEEEPVSEVFGYKPVYGSQESLAITLSDPIPVNEPGKIYEYGQYLFVNEVNKGIHVFNNSNPSVPMPVAFLRIYGNTEMAIRNNVLYANHVGSIVAIDLKDLNSIETLASLPLQTSEGGVLPPKGFYFECIDAEKGIVLNWVQVERQNMDCYAIR